MQMLCMRHRITTESSTNKGAKELKHNSKNLQQQWPQGGGQFRPAAVIFAKGWRKQSTRSARAGSAMMKSTVTSVISRELQCNQELILEVSVSKTMSFGLIDTTAFCLRANIQQMLFALITSSRKIPVARYWSQDTSRKVPVTRYQSQDTSRKVPVKRYQSQGTSRKVPVAEYTSRKMMYQSQAIVHPITGYSVWYPVAGNPDTGKADVVKSCNQAQRIQSSKYPDAVFEDTTSSEAVEELNYEELPKLDVNC
ncbi:hypothetical protein F511_39677 [Dorcoceras hygrometricum]|uniref:Uncharacterized protein n=1 Tax=Dorcoceras hygrometricum TaxID=472368 RepID=A0A2Z7CW94_9LAMI|nr:hypothetical protein F511_39677 [Dorcoceras hygrometricum]